MTDEQIDRLAAYAHDLVDELAGVDRSLTYENQDYATATWPSWEDQARRHVEVCTLAGEMRARKTWNEIVMVFHAPRSVAEATQPHVKCFGCDKWLNDSVGYGPAIQLADGMMYCSARCAWDFYQVRVKEENANA